MNSPTPTNDGSPPPSVGPADFYVANQRALLAYAMSLTRNFYDAEDAAAEAVVKSYEYYQRHGTISPPGKEPLAWLKNIIRNTVIDNYRRRKMAQEESAERRETITGDVAEEVIDGLIAQQFFTELRSLPAQATRIAYLYFAEGWNYKEIAVDLEIPESAVRSSIARSRRRLRQNLGVSASEAAEVLADTRAVRGVPGRRVTRGRDPQVDRSGHADAGQSGKADSLRWIGSRTGGAGRHGPTAESERTWPPRRYLRCQCPQGVRVGEAFSLLASIVLSSAGGRELRPFDIPQSGRDVLLVLHAPGLRVSGPERLVVHVPATHDSDPVMFELRADIPGLKAVSVTAWADGTYLGELTIEISAEHTHQPVPHQDIRVEIASEAVDGAVSLVVRYDQRERSYRFEFRDLDNPQEVTSQLARDPGALVERLVSELDQFARGETGYSSAQTRDYLVNAGAELWHELVPARLREQFWERQHRIRQLTILADNDAVPWELLYPMDPGHDAGFLVEQFPVTRAIFGRRLAKRLNLHPTRFVLPPDPPPRAREEIVLLNDLLSSAQATSAEVISELSSLLHLIRSSGFGLLHFACHNLHEPQAGSSIILGKQLFTPRLLATAAIGHALIRSQPMIFINACRSAGSSVSYYQLEGWATKFLEAGASAFIGSQWTVRDSSACIFAAEFYRQIRAGTQLGHAAMRARDAAASEPGDPTWLAYAVYGDPLATYTSTK